MFIYCLALVFLMIPMTIRTYLSVRAGVEPLPTFQNNLVVNRINVRRSLGVLSPILFWVFHAFYALWALADGAPIAALAAIVYMVVSTMLSVEMKAKNIGVVPAPAAPGKEEP